MTPFVWMFIKTYEKLRQFIIQNKSITTLIQMEYSAFEEATVPICSFVLQNKRAAGPGIYFRLSDFKGGMEVQRQKVLEALADKDCGYLYEAQQENFEKIPGAPVAYWASNTIINDFSIGKSLSSYAEPKQGMATMDNNKYLRMWYEVDSDTYYLHAHSLEEAKASRRRWFPYNKGGDYRKWYGNFTYLVDWEDDGAELKADASKIYGSYSKRIYNTQYFFLPSITWSKISSGQFSARCISDGCLFDVAGCSIFVDKKLYHYFSALLNSKIIGAILSIISPTLNYEVGHIKSLPIIIDNGNVKSVSKIGQKCIIHSKADWDSSETSWDFKRHPLA